MLVELEADALDFERPCLPHRPPERDRILWVRDVEVPSGRQFVVRHIALLPCRGVGELRDDLAREWSRLMRN